jgi:hypothetical protein
MAFFQRLGNLRFNNIGVGTTVRRTHIYVWRINGRVIAHP